MHEETAWTLAEGDGTPVLTWLYIRGSVYHCKKV